MPWLDSSPPRAVIAKEIEVDAMTANSKATKAAKKLQNRHLCLYFSCELVDTVKIGEASSFYQDFSPDSVSRHVCFSRC